MLELKRMVCKSCGGLLKDVSALHTGGRWLCEYCGAEYMVKTESAQRNIVEVVPARCDAVRAQVMIDRSLIDKLPKEEVRKIAVMRLASDIAKTIAENVKIKEEDDLYMDAKKYTAQIRIIKENATFGTASGELSADRIKAGTIDANYINFYGISKKPEEE